MKIGINCGHTISGAGSGAIGIINESQQTRAVGYEVMRLLKERSADIVDCTINSAASQSACLAAIVEQANREDLDWFISIHFNAGGGRGVEVYTYEGRQYPDALEVCENIAALGFVNRGVKKGTGLYVINKTKAKTMLIEVCFVDTDDANRYLSLGATKIAEVITDALIDYVAPIQVSKEVWYQTQGKWRYKDSSGEDVRGKWIVYKSKWFFLDEAGWMLTGVVNINNELFYLCEDSGSDEGACMMTDSRGALKVWIIQ